MNKVELGTLVTPPASRDAIHVAVIPMFAGRELQPGQKVVIRNGVAIPAEEDGRLEDFEAIVDPFLEEPVRPRTYCWLMMRPGTVTDLRHHWSHASIPFERDDQDETEEDDQDETEEDDGCRGC